MKTITYDNFNNLSEEDKIKFWVHSWNKADTEIESLKEEIAALNNYKVQAYEQLKRMNDVVDENKSLKEQLKQRDNTVDIWIKSGIAQDLKIKLLKESLAEVLNYDKSSVSYISVIDKARKLLQ